MLDTIQVVLWSVTYALIVIAGIRSRGCRMVSIPYTAGVLNFAWEACALQQSQGMWGHLIWFGLDLGIVYFGFEYSKSWKQRILYVAAICTGVLVMWYIFAQQQGMLVSAFALDLFMAVLFIVERRKLSPELKVPIAVARLLGDFVAGLFYAPESMAVCIMVVAVTLCNMAYLLLCIREYRAKK